MGIIHQRALSIAWFCHGNKMRSPGNLALCQNAIYELCRTYTLCETGLLLNLFMNFSVYAVRQTSLKEGRGETIFHSFSHRWKDKSMIFKSLTLGVTVGRWLLG